LLHSEVCVYGTEGPLPPPKKNKNKKTKKKPEKNLELKSMLESKKGEGVS